MENNKIINVIFKAWDDPEFKKNLLKDPKKVLREEGIAIPENVNIVVNEDSAAKKHLIIPQKPSEQLSEEELEAISAGAGSIWGNFSEYVRSQGGMGNMVKQFYEWQRTGNLPRR